MRNLPWMSARHTRGIPWCERDLFCPGQTTPAPTPNAPGTPVCKGGFVLQTQKVCPCQTSAQGKHQWADDRVLILPPKLQHQRLHSRACLVKPPQSVCSEGPRIPDTVTVNDISQPRALWGIFYLIKEFAASYSCDRNVLA